MGLNKRSTSDWLLDLSGGANQAFLIPWLQSTMVFGGLLWIGAEYRGSLKLSPLSAFLLNFVVVDYLYYWNHRLLHTQRFWNLHSVHHEARVLDVFTTGRNSLWTPLAIVYLWLNGVALFLLSDGGAYLAAITVSVLLDIWRHSSLMTNPNGRFHKFIRLFLITPIEHRWHHSSDRFGINFGGNLSIWDRLHETYFTSEIWPEKLGVPVSLSLTRKILWPWGNQ